MVKLADIARIWQKKADERKADGLAANFGELAAMRQYVPYLRDFKLSNTTLQSGDARSSFKGRGMEFEEVRAYAYGDDTRDIDWRVTARKSQPYTKLYAEEKDREVFVWLDLSAHMRFGTRKELKSVTAAKIAALLGWYALNNKDRFGVAVFDGYKTYVFEPQRTQGNLLAILKRIEKISVESLYYRDESQDVVKSLRIMQKRMSRRAIVFMISGFAEISGGLAHEITNLARRNELYMINVFDVLEDKAPPAGQYLAEYDTFKQLLDVSGKGFEKNYSRYFAEKRGIIRNFCAKFNCRYREVRTDLPVYTQIRPV